MIDLIFVSLPAQRENRNLLQIKYNLNYFKGSALETISNVPTPNISFTRFLKNDQYLISFEIDELGIYYNDPFQSNGNNSITERTTVTLELKSGYKLMLTPKSNLVVKAGMAFRVGWETHYLYTIYHQFWAEQFTKRYKYHNPGAELSSEYLLLLNKKLSFCLGGGYQYFIARNTTNHHLRANAGLGYLF